MTRSELDDTLAIENNISISASEKIITEIFKSMSDTLATLGVQKAIEVSWKGRYLWKSNYQKNRYYQQRRL
jgi:nucleoid DNA-binding protein